MPVTKREIVIDSFSKDKYGIQSKEGVWYNRNDKISDQFKEDVKAIFSKLSNGDMIELTADFQTRKFDSIIIKKKSEKKEVVKKESTNVVQIHGKDHVTYKALLDQAHKKGFKKFEILEQSITSDLKLAWVKVRLWISDKEFYDGIGSCTPENANNLVKDHPIEMAHTRSKARAFRDYLNIGQAAIEELKKE